jgi:nucleoid DNA-binding protein
MTDPIMTEAELRAAIASETGLSESSVGNVIDSLVDHINEEPRIAIPGLGIFRHIIWASRKIKNRHTGEDKTIPEKSILVFKAGNI